MVGFTYTGNVVGGLVVDLEEGTGSGGNDSVEVLETEKENDGEEPRGGGSKSDGDDPVVLATAVFDRSFGCTYMTLGAL
jgi:hypothetical protein